MKRLFLIIFALFLLTACGKEEPPVVQEEVVATPVETAPAVEEVPIIVDELPEETEVTAPETVAYTSEAVEGLVEDTVGYLFEIPTFEVPGAEAIRTYYAELAEHLVDYTKQTVYPEAAGRGCIVSVYAEVVSAKIEEEILTVDYVFRCDYSDTEENAETLRTDSFHIQTGEKQ